MRANVAAAGTRFYVNLFSGYEVLMTDRRIPMPIMPRARTTIPDGAESCRYSSRGGRSFSRSNMSCLAYARNAMSSAEHIRLSLYLARCDSSTRPRHLLIIMRLRPPFITQWQDLGDIFNILF